MRCMAEVSYKMLCELGKTKAVMTRALRNLRFLEILLKERASLRTVNRSGFSGGSKSRKDWSHGKGQQSKPLFT